MKENERVGREAGMLLGLVLLTLSIYWLELIYQLGAQWSVYEQYNYGWAVPFLCAFLVWQRVWRKDGECSTPNGGTKTTLRGFQPPTSLLLFLFALCILLYAPTRLLHEANPIWRLTSWIWAVEVVVITLVLLHFTFRASGSRLRVSQFLFPVCFFLVAVPWPSGLEFRLVQFLTHLNVSATTEWLGWFGIPALQHGNVIEVSTGNVGVDEACSGIRSFQATLMLALFFGQIYRLTFSRRLLCVFAGFAFSFLFNMVRTTLLTWIAAKQGPAAMAHWHDPAGVTILVTCFLALWLAALWLRPKHRSERAAGNNQIDESLKTETLQAGCTRTLGSISPRLTASTTSALTPQHSTVRGLAIGLLVWFVLVEAGTQFWFGIHENSAASREHWTVNVEGTGLHATKVEIPTDVLSQFRADEHMEAQWRDDAGNAWQLYYFRWFPTHSLSRRVDIQLAKTHGPEKCLPAVGAIMKSDLGVTTVRVGDNEFAFRRYVFLADGQPLYVFYAIYEDQTGSSVLANRRQDTARRIAAALAGSRNDGQRYLELFVTGPANAEDAAVDLRQELKKLIVMN